MTSSFMNSIEALNKTVCELEVVDVWYPAHEIHHMERMKNVDSKMEDGTEGTKDFMVTSNIEKTDNPKSNGLDINTNQAVPVGDSAKPSQVSQIETLSCNISKSLEKAAAKWNGKMRKAFKLSAALDARFVDWKAGMISDDYFLCKLQEISDSAISVIPLNQTSREYVY